MPIHIVLENGLAPVAAIHQVVDRAGMLHSQFARHDREVTRTARFVTITNRPLTRIPASRARDGGRQDTEHAFCVALQRHGLQRMMHDNRLLQSPGDLSVQRSVARDAADDGQIDGDDCWERHQNQGRHSGGKKGHPRGEALRASNPNVDAVGRRHGCQYRQKPWPQPHAKAGEGWKCPIRLYGNHRRQFEDKPHKPTAESEEGKNEPVYNLVHNISTHSTGAEPNRHTEHENSVASLTSPASIGSLWTFS